MSGIYEFDSKFIVVAEGMVNDQAMSHYEIGVGSSIEEALQDIEVSPVSCNLPMQSAIELAFPDHDPESIDPVNVYVPDLTDSQIGNLTTSSLDKLQEIGLGYILLSEDLPAGTAMLGDAEGWYDGLGYSPDGDHAHPICDIDEVPNLSYDDEVAEKWTQRKDSQPTKESKAAYFKLVSYAEEARSAALSIEDSLDKALDAWHTRDSSEVLANLRDAYSMEKEWGDYPDTRHAASLLLSPPLARNFLSIIRS